MVHSAGQQAVARTLALFFPGGDHVPAQADGADLRQQHNNILSTSITEQTFRGNKFAVGIPTSVIPGQPFSGVSSRSGDLLTCLFKNLTPLPERRAVRAHISIVAETILELRENGATLLE